jgi:hypothetical protein
VRNVSASLFRKSKSPFTNSKSSRTIYAKIEKEQKVHECRQALFIDCLFFVGIEKRMWLTLILKLQLHVE